MAPQPKCRQPAKITPIRLAALYTITLRVAYSAFAAVALRHIAIDPRLVRSNAFTGHLMPPSNSLAYTLLGAWERFDTLWYLHIAQSGYDRQAAVVFYPLYPLLIRLVSYAIRPPLLAALAISTAGAFFFAWGLAKLMELDLPRATARRAIWLLAVWPASFILFAAYADSLVMAATVWSICFARERRWWAAAITGLAGGFTKAIGCLAGVAIGWVAWREDRRQTWAAAVPLAAPAAFSLWIRQAGYQSSAAAYAAHWNTRAQLPWVTLADSVRAFFAHPPSLLLRLNLIFLLLVCGLAGIRRLRAEYKLFVLAAVALFLTKATTPLLQSTVRYTVAVFPVFIGLAMLLEKRRVGMAILWTLFLLANAFLLYGFIGWELLV